MCCCSALARLPRRSHASFASLLMPMHPCFGCFFCAGHVPLRLPGSALLPAGPGAQPPLHIHRGGGSRQRRWNGGQQHLAVADRRQRWRPGACCRFVYQPGSILALLVFRPAGAVDLLHLPGGRGHPAAAGAHAAHAEHRQPHRKLHRAAGVRGTQLSKLLACIAGCWRASKAARAAAAAAGSG